jgi:hypothetical protein
MNTFWIKNKYRIVGAALGIFFHLVLLGFAALVSQGFFIIGFLDLPLWVLAELVSLREKYYVFLFTLGGTLMYALIGWMSGPILERFDVAGKKRPDKNFQHNSNDKEE